MVVHEQITSRFSIWAPRRQIPAFGWTISNVFRMTLYSF